MIKKCYLSLLLFTISNFIIAQNSDTANFISTEKNCSFYFDIKWLPDAYIYNAYCACISLPNTIEANSVRLYLKNQIESVSDSIVNLGLSQKMAYKSQKISRIKYNRYIKKTITPIIYKHHKDAYKFAGCKGKPAPYLGWKFITTSKIKSCKLTWLGIRFFGSCHSRFGKW